MSQHPILSSGNLPSRWQEGRDDTTFPCQDLNNGKFLEVLTSPLARILLGHFKGGDAPQSSLQTDGNDWRDLISRNAELILNTPPTEGKLPAHEELLVIGIAALQAFLQSNVTGPPLSWRPAEIIFPAVSQRQPKELQRHLIATLTIEGEAAYQLTPNVELFCLAKYLLDSPLLVQSDATMRWARVRVNFWHQRLLTENAASLQESIYDDLTFLDNTILVAGSQYPKEVKVQYLLEKAAINTHHGLDAKAREDLGRASKETGFAYALTGRLGKRTKFQEKELSQLVVLAKSAADTVTNGALDDSGLVNGVSEGRKNGDIASRSKPQNLDLNDDTLLESISFSQNLPIVTKEDTESLPASLNSLDPANQPLLDPLDSIILLSLASSITNTSPQHGLTREETLPYATRVLDAGSANWQIYTQALLVRSRIEGYRSRTVERGVLQLQALVDQVIAETTSSQSLEHSVGKDDKKATMPSTTTFLPRPKPSESAPATERLQYVHQLASPPRWTLEAELAARWVSLGGLRTALEIYERLEMWAEAALCWAAVEREDKARRMIRRQLYNPKPSSKDASVVDWTDPADEDSEEYLGEERDPLPVDAPRLFCILGDLDSSPTMYERAWEVSNSRYARAQRSLGKFYLSKRDLLKADEAYSKSLKINQLNQNSWFALGCVRLELQNWKGAVEAFSRTVQIEAEDAEAWSNLAAALLRLSPEEYTNNTHDPASNSTPTDRMLSEDRPKPDSQRHVKEAFVALKRAAALKRDSYRIWQNLLNVSTTISPPPYTDLIIAQQRLIELRGPVEGESCIDIEVMEGLLAHVIASAPTTDSKNLPAEVALDDSQHPPEQIPIEAQQHRKHGLESMFTTLLRQHITPLITHSRRLWLLTARLALHQNRPSSALEAYEKAWRVTLSKPGWELGGVVVGPSSSTSRKSTNKDAQDEQSPKQVWQEVVEATEELADAYESLGERQRTEGLGEGGLVCKEWKFKARSAIRSVLGRGKEAWEGTEEYERLRERMDDLKGGR
ncbi:hypothetical protein MMC24_003057 [Lignoscripta atroalba]|nr:hypothetical protein [Lignoscripta atroalba]